MTKRPDYGNKIVVQFDDGANATKEPNSGDRVVARASDGMHTETGNKTDFGD